MRSSESAVNPGPVSMRKTVERSSAGTQWAARSASDQPRASRRRRMVLPGGLRS